MSLTRPRFPKNKTCMVVSDYPIKTEVEQDAVYSSASNMTFMGDLYKIGIEQTDCFFTYFSYERPGKESYDFIKEFAKHKSLEPAGTGLGIAGEVFHKYQPEKDLHISETLWKEFQGLLETIRQVQPKIIIITGKWSLFFLTNCVPYSKTQGNWKDRKPLGGLNKFRASILELDSSYGFSNIIVYPMLPPTTKLRSPEKAPIIQWDFNKLGEIYKEILAGNAKKFLDPEKSYYFEQNFDYILGLLDGFIANLNREPFLVSVDIETRQFNIDCIGFTAKTHAGICIALSTLENPLIWTEDQELELVLKMKQLLAHPNCRIVGQNFNYDAQYLYKFWLLDVHSYLDTMILHHCMYNYMPKSLDFLASIYCDSYKYWKDLQKFTKLDG